MTETATVGGTTAFCAQYVLGNIGLVGIITLVNTGIALIITPFIPKIISMFGKKNVFQFCGVFTIVGGVGLFFTPANMFWLVLLTLTIKGDVVWQEPATTGPAGSDLD